MLKLWKTLLLSAFFFTSAGVHAAEVVTLASGEWAPYQSKNLKNGGFISQVITESFAEEGYEVKFVYLPWKRGFEEAKAGRYDGSFIWRENEERKADFLFSEPVIFLSTSLFQQKGKDFTWDKPQDLAKFKIGGVVGYAYGIEDLEKEGVVKIRRITNPDNNYKKLVSGRLDFVLEDHDVGLETINRLGMSDKVVANAKALQSNSFHMIFPKKSARSVQLLEVFNRGLVKLKADGRLQKYRDASNRGEYKTK